MSGQGKVIAQIAEVLARADWRVVFACLPNTAHIMVVPFPTPASRHGQRYPDLVAVKDEYTKIIEVERSLRAGVVQEILERFEDDLSALRDTERWESWRGQVMRQTGIRIPEAFRPQCDLILCSPIHPRYETLITQLVAAGVRVSSAETYTP